MPNPKAIDVPKLGFHYIHSSIILYLSHKSEKIRSEESKTRNC